MRARVKRQPKITIKKKMSKGYAYMVIENKIELALKLTFNYVHSETI